MQGLSYLHPNRISDPNATTAIHEIALTYTDYVNPDVIVHEVEILRKMAFVKDCHDIHVLLEELYQILLLHTQT